MAEKYFGAFVYLANWGTHVLKLRLPTRLLNTKTARQYCAGERASVREKNGKLILTFVSDDEHGGDWVEGEGHLSSLISVRAELGRGDLRFTSGCSSAHSAVTSTMMLANRRCLRASRS